MNFQQKATMERERRKNLRSLRSLLWRPFFFQSLVTYLPGQAGTTTFMDTYTAGAHPHFYRVGVDAP